MESTHMRNEPFRSARRKVLAGGASLALMAAMLGTVPTPAAASLTQDKAEKLIDKLVADINRIINSGMSEERMYEAFERDIFARYGDVPTIARSVLGPPARSASASQMKRFAEAFQHYMSRKYGRRFREFIGGKIRVQRTEPWKSHYQVHTVVELQGNEPFSVIFRVSDRSGAPKFFDMVIEGVSLLKSEAVEIRAMLDKRRGDLDKLIRDLNAYA